MIKGYLKNTPDPDRDYAIAALTGGLMLRHAKAGTIRALIESRYDAKLFRLFMILSAILPRP